MKERAFRESFVHLFSVTLFFIILLSPQYCGAFDKEIRDMCATMATKIVQSGKRTIAVTDFTDLEGNVTQLGRFIGERYCVALSQAGEGFAVVDRMHIKALLREHKLSASGLIDPDTARKLGKIAGIDALVVGTLTLFGEVVEMNIKILDTETAKVIYAGTGKLPKTDAIKNLSEQGLGTEKPDSPGDNGQKKPLARPLQRDTAHGFTFELLECKRSGSSVSCKLRVTSNERDRELTLWGTGWTASVGSRMFDDAGNEYLASGVHLGRQANKSRAENVLAANVPTLAELQFEGISPQAHIIRLLEIRIFASDYHSVKFQDVAFSR